MVIEYFLIMKVLQLYKVDLFTIKEQRIVR
jgi:hypothetical protein